jgi:hypothetical protein
MKATGLEEVCRGRGLTSVDVAGLDDATKRDIETAAGTRVASADTWAMVVRFMAGYETNRAHG